MTLIGSSETYQDLGNSRNVPEDEVNPGILNVG